MSVPPWPIIDTARMRNDSRKILLIRHAQSEFHGRFCGSSDPPLSLAGKVQAQELAGSLRRAKIAHIYCSPLQRALVTAEAIVATTACPLTIVSDLREIHFGSWEGLTWDEIESRDPVHARLWKEQYPELPAPGGELFAVFQQRVNDAFRQICSKLGAGSDKVAVVAHAGVLGVVVATVSGKPFRSMPQPANGAVIEIVCPD